MAITSPTIEVTTGSGPANAVPEGSVTLPQENGATNSQTVAAAAAVDNRAPPSCETRDEIVDIYRASMVVSTVAYTPQFSNPQVHYSSPEIIHQHICNGDQTAGMFYDKVQAVPEGTMNGGLFIKESFYF